MYCVHYGDLVADNCYYPDWADVVMTYPNTDDNGGSLQPQPAWQIFNYRSRRKKKKVSTQIMNWIESKKEKFKKFHFV